MKQCPIGLVVFAVINFILAGSMVLGFVLFFLAKGFMPDLIAQSELSFNAYGILFTVVTFIVLILSGIGFLRMNYRLGYIGGLIFSFGTLTDILVFYVLSGFENPAQHIPNIIYPIVLLVFLIFRYKPYFKDDKKIQKKPNMKSLTKKLLLVLSIISTVTLGIVAIGSFFIFPHFSKLFEDITVPHFTTIILYSYKLWWILPLTTLLVGINTLRRQELSKKYFVLSVIIFGGGIIIAFLLILISVVAMYLPIFEMADLH